MSVISSVTALYPTYSNRSSMEDFFPKAILDAIGGPEKMENLEQISDNEIPDYAPNISNLRYSWDGPRKLIIQVPEGPMIKRGFDKERRPFLEVYVPGYPPLQYYTSSSSSKPADFTNLKNWSVHVSDNGHNCSCCLDWLCSRTENVTLLLSQIMEGKYDEKTRQSLSQYL